VDVGVALLLASLSGSELDDQLKEEIEFIFVIQKIQSYFS